MRPAAAVSGGGARPAATARASQVLPPCCLRVAEAGGVLVLCRDVLLEAVAAPNATPCRGIGSGAAGSEPVADSEVDVMEQDVSLQDVVGI